TTNCGSARPISSTRNTAWANTTTPRTSTASRSRRWSPGANSQLARHARCSSAWASTWEDRDAKTTSIALLALAHARRLFMRGANRRQRHRLPGGRRGTGERDPRAAAFLYQRRQLGHHADPGDAAHRGHLPRSKPTDF